MFQHNCHGLTFAYETNCETAKTRTCFPPPTKWGQFIEDSHWHWGHCLLSLSTSPLLSSNFQQIIRNRSNTDMRPITQMIDFSAWSHMIVRRTMFSSTKKYGAKSWLQFYNFRLTCLRLRSDISLASASGEILSTEGTEPEISTLFPMLLIPSSVWMSLLV